MPLDHRELFHNLFVNDVPLLDVRAPVEFNQGAFPSAINLPILDDEERRLVGTCYREEGSAAAERLGYSLVSGKKKAARVAAWIAFIEDNPGALLYCFRGGKRSQITQGWLAEAGVPIERIEGGYKRLRQYLLEVINEPPPLLLLSGRTGTGKTKLLTTLPQHLDLEGLARHRGSAFGKRATPQPAQIDFENAMAIQILKHPGAVIVEDESKIIGRIHIPPILQAAMKAAPIVVLEDNLQNRAERIEREYIQEADRPLPELRAYFESALHAIRKRLGGVRHIELTGLMKEAFDHQTETGETTGHRIWISTLLAEYYDPMYDYQLSKKSDRIIRSGDMQGLRELLSDGPQPILESARTLQVQNR